MALSSSHPCVCGVVGDKVIDDVHASSTADPFACRPLITQTHTCIRKKWGGGVDCIAKLSAQQMHYGLPGTPTDRMIEQVLRHKERKHTN